MYELHVFTPSGLFLFIAPDDATAELWQDLGFVVLVAILIGRS